MQEFLKNKTDLFSVSGMSCAACSSRVEKTVASLPGVEACSVNLLTGDLRVEGSAEKAEIIRAVEGIGYGCKSQEEASGESDSQKSKAANEDREVSRIRNQLIVSVILLLMLMYISMGIRMTDLPDPFGLRGKPVLTAGVELLLSSCVLLFGKKYFINGWKALLRRSPGMDTLIMLGSGISWLWSLGVFLKMCSLLSDGLSMEEALTQADLLSRQLYFNSAAMIPTLITIGKLLESKAKGKTTDAINGLKNLKPLQAVRVTPDGQEEQIPAENLQPGDRFVLKPGESVPADGRVLQGEGLFDESALTGESRSVEKRACREETGVSEENRVYAATINKTGHLLCLCEKSGNDTVLAQIIRLVTDASATKAPVARLADKAAGIFVPAVLLIAFLTFLLWILAGEPVSAAIQRAVSVLVISCPCALGLATPVAIMVANGVGAENGILFKTAESLEITGKMKIAVFDKTGTITTGRPKVTGIITGKGIEEEELLRAAASLEAASEHPLAKAITEYARIRSVKPGHINGFQATGSSISGEYLGHRITAGSRRSAFLAGVSEGEVPVPEDEILKNTEAGRTPVYFIKDRSFLGIIFCEDSIREDAGIAVEELKKQGIETVLLSGDEEKVAKKVAGQVGISRVIAGVLPSEKAEWIRELKKEAEVLMVGDGINDAPALTVSDIGMAVASGTDIAMDASDVVLMKSELKDVPAAILLSRETLKTIRLNLFWAVFYNVLCIPAAAGLLIPFGIELNPMIGAAAMSLSSLFVVTNALRLNKLMLYPEENKEEEKKMTTEIRIQGMMCPHCEARVKNALEQIPGVEKAEVSHVKGTAVVTGAVAEELLKKAVRDAGYEAD